MHRCKELAGRFEVKCEYLDGNYGTVRESDVILDIGEHEPVYAIHEGKQVLVEDIPRTSRSTPYVGELCVHELDWVTHMPGKVYSPRRRYYVTRLDEPKKSGVVKPKK